MASACRFRAAPSTQSDGLQSLAKPLVAFTSATSHYSYLKAANLVGIGTANLVKVQVCVPRDWFLYVKCLGNGAYLKRCMLLKVSAMGWGPSRRTQRGGWMLGR
jgi:hypothetical protein